MIALNTPVLVGALSEPAVVVGREPLACGGVMYRVRFPNGAVRAFGARWVRVGIAEVVRLPRRPALRLATVNGVEVRP